MEVEAEAEVEEVAMDAANGVSSPGSNAAETARASVTHLHHLCGRVRGWLVGVGIG